MKIGYARVSTEDQKLDLQREALRRGGCAKIFQEKRSGATDRRPALERAMQALGGGDVLVVWKLDRLGRSLQDLIAVLDQLDRRGIGFCSLSDGIDTTTPAGKLLFHVTGAVAEFERALISERTKAGMAVARRDGKRQGRPRKLTAMQESRVQHMAIVDEIPLPEIAEQMGVSMSTVRRAIAPIKRHSKAMAAEHAALMAERGIRFTRLQSDPASRLKHV